MNKNLSMVAIVPLKSTIEKLMVAESGSVSVNAVCNEFLGKINEGVSETELCESFVVEISKLVESKAGKNAISSLSESIKANANNIKLANAVSALKNGPCVFVAPVIESAVVDYITNKNSVTRDNVRVSVSLFEGEKNVTDILDVLNYETYEEKSGKKLKVASYNESCIKDDRKERTYTQDEVNAIIESKMSEAPVQEYQPRTYKDIRVNLGLSASISNILKENASNEKLRVYCEQYINALNSGYSEESLCESFVSGIGNWNYLSAVDTEMSALAQRIGKYKQEINIKKVMETMLQTSSYYIVPLIEDCVVEYVDNKNMQTRGAMLQRLYSFEYDPFVRDIIGIVTKDMSLDNTVKIEESLATSTHSTEYVYSPISYIKENECVFNVRGSYFVKKGNSISKLTKKAVAELSESFKSLCNIVNSGNVVFSTIDESVSVYDGSNMAVISESEIIVNNKKVTVPELDALTESAISMNDSNKNFYGLVKIMNENYNNIAYIDFVKRVSSKDGSGLAVDVFKLKNNIFVNTVNENLGISTFYRNVNPIQCRNYINEHMGINVAPMFEDVLPDQENVKKNISEKNEEYKNYIASLEDKKETLLNMKNDDNASEIDKVIATIDKELEDTKSDYEKYQKDTDKFMNGDDADREDSLDDEVPDVDGVDDMFGDDESDVKQTETPAEMEVPIEQGSPADDIVTDLPDEFADASYFDSDFDSPVPASDDNDASFKVVDVAYHKNVKSGECTGKGEVLIKIPCVDANGDVRNETRKVAFYVDCSGEERKIVINNDYMPLDLYLAIEDAIEACPETESICVGSPMSVVGDDPFGDDSFGGDEEKTDDLDIAVPSVDTAATITKEKNVDGGDVAVEPVKVETPAEVTASGEKPKYPITVGVYPDEISPIPMDDFKKSLDGMKISHSESECNDGQLIMEIKNRAQAGALRAHFNEWLNYNDEQFEEFFPEMKGCFRRVNEGVKIRAINALTESKSTMAVTLPATAEYFKMFGITPNNNCEKIRLISESKDEERKIYEALYIHARKNNYRVEQDVLDLLECYSDEYYDVVNESAVYDLILPYNGFLSAKLSHKGFSVNESEKHMSVQIYKNDFNKAKKVLESFYGKKDIPLGVQDFFQYASSLNEAVTITIRDDKTGKTVEINTDDALDGKSNGASSDMTEEGADFESSFNNVTFDPKESLAFNDEEEDADDDDENDDADEKGDESSDDNSNDNDESTDGVESEESTDEESDTDDSSEESTDEESNDNDSDKSENSEDKPKKKFKFKAKKKNESYEIKSENVLNESVVPTVMDYVKLKSNGRKGQVISHFSDDRNSMVVHVDGHTVVCTPKDVEFINPKQDTLPPTMKFDPLTLKGVYESYVGCGLFVNNVRVTPPDCCVKVSEFFSKSDNEEVSIVMEGETTSAIKKYISLTEDVNNVIDIANYVPGKMNVSGVDINVLIHKGDYTKYKNVKESYEPVRTLVFDNGKETSMRLIPGTALRLDSADDLYIPESEMSINDAINKLLM